MSGKKYFYNIIVVVGHTFRAECKMVELCQKFLKILENIQRGDPFSSFLFNTVFYCVIPNETIRMPFRGLTMTKSRKLTKKGGLCYRFAMVLCKPSQHIYLSIYSVPPLWSSLCVHLSIHLFSTPSLFTPSLHPLSLPLLFTSSLLL